MPSSGIGRNWQLPKALSVLNPKPDFGFLFYTLVLKRFRYASRASLRLKADIPKMFHKSCPLGEWLGCIQIIYLVDIASFSPRALF
jgi:hypothetical protein